MRLFDSSVLGLAHVPMETRLSQDTVDHPAPIVRSPHCEIRSAKDGWYHRIANCRPTAIPRFARHQERSLNHPFCGDCAWDFVQAWMQYILRVTIDIQKTSKRGEAYLCRDSRGSECSSVALMLTCDPRLILQLPTHALSTLRASRRVISI